MTTAPATNLNQLSIPIIGKVLDELVLNCDKRHRLIVGGRGKGASWSIARELITESVDMPLTTVCVREVQKTIKHSVKKLLMDTINAYDLQSFFTETESEIKGINGSLYTFVGLRDYNADNFKSFEGADRCWVAEAQSISRRSINILRPTIRKEGSVIWWDFNPRYDTDPVYLDYIVHKDPNAKVLWLKHSDNPWFTKPLQLEMQADYERNEEEARHIWEGELRSMGEHVVCPSERVIRAMDRTIEVRDIRPGSKTVVGADIAHQGGDEITFYKKIGYKVVDTMIMRYKKSFETKKALIDFMGGKDTVLNIDNGHIGAAIADEIEDDGYTVNRVNFGGSPSDKEHYEDAVTEMYFNLRDILDLIDIPNDEELLAQISHRRYNYINGKRGYEVMKIESKDDFKDHSIAKSKSPDRADGLVLAFYEPEEGSFGFGTF